jgi:signal transduction histidine kinase
VSGANRIKSGDRHAILGRALDQISGRWARYGVAVAVVAIGYGVSRLFGHMLDLEVYLLPFLSILIVSIVGGLGPGLLATALAAIATYQTVRGDGLAAIVRVTIEGALLSLVGGSLRKEQRRVNESLEANLKLERQVLEISDDERRRIGLDLHDRLGQQLTGISLLSETLAQQLTADEKPDLRKVETITRLVSEAVGITRDLAGNLSPITLVREGLPAAIAELAETSSSVFGIRCICESQVKDLTLDNARSLHVFRMVQEAVSNSVRHGRAKNVRIGLRSDNAQLIVTVIDDGSGLSPKTTATPGLGLRIMHYRARILSASLTVERTAPSGGTTVTCRCPL